MPNSDDATAIFHALGLRFSLPDGEEWRMALDQTPVFVVSSAADFVALQIASKRDPATGKPDPVKMKAYLSTHPETQSFFDYLAKTPMPSSFANGTYHSIDAFRFTGNDGNSRFVRWQFEPETPFTALDKSKPATLAPDFLFDDLQSRIHQGPLKWHMVVVEANPGDRTDNATVAWGSGHRTFGRLFRFVPTSREGRAAPGCPDARSTRSTQGRTAMSDRNAYFGLPARILHWLMAALIVAMLFIGAGMVSTVGARYPELLAWHRPIGIMILVLAIGCTACSGTRSSCWYWDWAIWQRRSCTR